jgi:hypothetical protein
MRAFIYREEDRLRVVTPYVREFVDDLKLRIPYHARGFDPEAKHWLIDGNYEEELVDVMSEYFDVMTVVSEAEAIRRERAARAKATAEARPEPPPPHPVGECDRRVRALYREEATLYLLPGAPFPVIQAAYRALARMLHPDLAGVEKHDDMVRLNRAFEALERRVKSGAGG